MIHPDAPDPSLTLEELRQVINSALLRRSFIFSRVHAAIRSEDRNITFEDVIHICQKGKFKCDPRYVPDRQNWKYEVIGKDLDEVATTVVITVDDEKYWVTVITFF